MRRGRRVKIVATPGPASSAPETIEQLSQGRRRPWWRRGASWLPGWRSASLGTTNMAHIAYLIFYLPIAEADEVRILRIRHGRRKPLQPGEI